MAWEKFFSRGKVSEESRVMYNLCLKRASSIGLAKFISTDGQMNLEDAYRRDMLNFLIYIAYSDGGISKEEIKYINDLTGTQFTEKSIAQYANKWDLKTERIKDRAPRSLEAFVRSNNGPETGEISYQYYDLLSLYVTTYNYIGNDLIACNNDIKQGEIDTLSSYILFIKEHIADIKGRIEEYKPTIAFKPGSSVKKEDVSTYDEAYEMEESELEETQYFNDSDRERFEYSKPTYKPYGFGESRELNTERGSREYEYSEKSSNAVYNDYTKPKEKDIDEINKQTSEYEKVDIKPAEIQIIEGDTLDKLMEELNGLTGMESVKKEVANLVNLLKICRIRQSKGLQVPPTTNHLVFLGNPGTGKTTVARILSKIYHGLGVLSKGHLVEVDRSGLVAGYMGQTGEKVMEVVEKAKGGVLFIDEAYALAANKQDGDFGQEAIDILNKAMEDFRDDLIVIAAGYHDEMQEFLDANPGLRSRFNRTIEFPNYTAEELVEIICNRAAKLDYNFEPEALEFIKNKFNQVLSFPPENFGNARSVRNYLNNAINNQANRLVSETNLQEDELMTIKVEDLENLVLS